MPLTLPSECRHRCQGKTLNTILKRNGGIVNQKSCYGSKGKKRYLTRTMVLNFINIEGNNGFTKNKMVNSLKQGKLAPAGP
jgi:hypothetical protein